MNEKLLNIISLSTQVTKNLKKHLDDIDKEILSKHYGFNITEQVYNFLNNADVKCYCENNLKFISFKKGYSKFCSVKCQSIYREANWSDYMKEYRSNKISKSVTEVWESADNEWKEQRSNKISQAAKSMWESADNEWKEQRSNKISLKVSEYAKENKDELYLRDIKRSETMTLKSDFEKSQIYKKHINTKIENGNAIPKHLKSEFELYHEIVWRITNKNYYKNYHEINPNNLKRDRYSYHLDHKLSIFEGFKNNIPTYIIGSKYNLEIITATENLEKQRNSSTTLDELLEKIKDINEIERI